MSKRSTVVKEPDFQEVVNKAVRNSLEWMREHLDDAEQRERIMSEDALSVEVRSDWYAPGTVDEESPRRRCMSIRTGSSPGQLRMT